MKKNTQIDPHLLKEVLKNDAMRGGKELPPEPYEAIRRKGSSEDDKALRVFQHFLKFKISELIEKPIGTSQVYSFDLPVRFIDFDVKKKLKGKVEIMRIEDGFNACVTDLKLTVEFACVKCLRKFSKNIEIPHAERQFYFTREKALNFDPFDIYVVDQKHMEIDLSEMFRQEIILHFPVDQVCSSSCKGLCVACGINKNLKKCKCKILKETSLDNKPLKALKELLK
ncbi:DUF177 domain-containing protein [Candidatus Peregrinibacteria bacterium]|nr:DUF177 domain-containing protein [Candidatus Peregrinibacteria bacterium]